KKRYDREFLLGFQF
nr:Chain E, EUKARYOTIC TRANSLATION INITIATION FACTOR 4 GAMMA 1 [Homo sapiens]2W97_F Chain F, EUKARYOTIC TRANSLATION INITIATION FACTOR 4 GAMMA 1 [Homo sapiens]5EHC_B Chain B, Eukaryotic translation initiation factor 4 gamma 1 [Homo sapiens]5EI3_B Chain B, Eukaryotic translation initiation factor 4 gamma [synthetic construct]5EIR_B Chain B, Eukaryotic translation initiation factor 4 gamma 1 [synthetic construct]